MASSRSDRPPPQAGDLFEHFGVDTQPRPALEPTPVVEAQACEGCAWLLRVGRDSRCPVCGRACPAKCAEP